jgi:hypothetical protein
MMSEHCRRDERMRFGVVVMSVSMAEPRGRRLALAPDKLSLTRYVIHRSTRAPSPTRIFHPTPDASPCDVDGSQRWSPFTRYSCCWVLLGNFFL